MAVLLRGGEKEEGLPGGCRTVVDESSPAPVRCPLHTPAATMLCLNTDSEAQNHLSVD